MGPKRGIPPIPPEEIERLLVRSAPIGKQCVKEFNGEPEDGLCPDCREQNEPDAEDDDDADLGLGIL